MRNHKIRQEMVNNLDKLADDMAYLERRIAGLTSLARNSRTDGDVSAVANILSIVGSEMRDSARILREARSNLM